MEAWEIEANKKNAEDMKQKLGYAPNPYCETCKGFGKVHPLDAYARPNYSEIVMCKAKGCLRESYEKRPF